MPYELKTESTKERSPTKLRCASFPARLSETWGAVKGQDERPLFGGALDSPISHHRTSMLTSENELIKEDRHVGLDFYDLLIEALKFRLLSIRFTSKRSVGIR